MTEAQLRALTSFSLRWMKETALAGSRPRVERLVVMAYGFPPTVAVPLTGPCTVSRNVTSWSGWPAPAFSTPASKVVIGTHAPL